MNDSPLGQNVEPAVTEQPQPDLTQPPLDVNTIYPQPTQGVGMQPTAPKNSSIPGGAYVSTTPTSSGGYETAVLILGIVIAVFSGMGILSQGFLFLIGLSSSYHATMLSFTSVIGFILLIAMLIIGIGIAMRRESARVGYIALTVVQFVLAGFSFATVTLPAFSKVGVQAGASGILLVSVLMGLVFGFGPYIAVVIFLTRKKVKAVFH